MDQDNAPTEVAEVKRLKEAANRTGNWRRWGTFLAERQWGTVREDYSEDNSCWSYFSHEHARSRTYRWGEDGLIGWSDRKCRICFGIALWNHRDPFLKERLFGLTNPQGNHSEDVKECYYYLRATPTHSYQKALYKYPQSEFPYQELIERNDPNCRSRMLPEYELADTGIFEKGYFDVFIEYAKASPEDSLIKITIHNRGKKRAPLHVLPQIWFRNTWAFGGNPLSGPEKPALWADGETRIQLDRPSLGHYVLDYEGGEGFRGLIFTENSTNYQKLFNAANHEPYVKDAFHDHIVEKKRGVLNPEQKGTKGSAVYAFVINGGKSVTLRMRLREKSLADAPAFDDFDAVFAVRERECEEFYADALSFKMSAEAGEVCRQAHAGLIWTKQFYYYPVESWLPGDPAHLLPAHAVAKRRNQDWRHVFARDVLSMPDKWEYPWFAAWDLAFHMVPFARTDAEFAKAQLELLLREWYMHPNGQLPAYEFSFGDVNPPVHAWASWRVYTKEKKRTGVGDRRFLAGVFHKLLINFTWWVNRKDERDKGIFSGGFLGLDNIGVFERGENLPVKGRLEQADATAWMAFYCLCMLRISLELAIKDGRVQQPYEDMASKFLEHFVRIADAIHTHGGTGLWDEGDGFYYDQVATSDGVIKLRSRSLVGLLPLIAVETLTVEEIDKLPGFKKRFDWFRRLRKDLSRHINSNRDGHWLLAIASKGRLIRVLERMLDEEEFLSPHGIRSLSRAHKAHPYVLHVEGKEFSVNYAPGDSETSMFGGNSNWRGPIWFPINHLLIEALERYHEYFGDEFMVEYPSRSGESRTLRDVAADLKRRLASLFMLQEDGRRKCHGEDKRYSEDPHWKDLVLFYEFFHGDNGRGLGASHQTGWTALVATHLQELAENS
ncbi:MAG: glucosidase [Verrucomicrobiaceae bacterium]|nr:glucosidase [Verrucomicrobiaceae bacterium]